MKPVCLGMTAALAIATLAACSSDKSTTSPTAPSLPATPGATVSTLVVTNQPASGNTMQMVATARMTEILVSQCWFLGGWCLDQVRSSDD